MSIFSSVGNTIRGAAGSGLGFLSNAWSSISNLFSGGSTQSSNALNYNNPYNQALQQQNQGLPAYGTQAYYNTNQSYNDAMGANSPGSLHMGGSFTPPAGSYNTQPVSVKSGSSGSSAKSQNTNTQSYKSISGVPLSAGMVASQPVAQKVSVSGMQQGAGVGNTAGVVQSAPGTSPNYASNIYANNIADGLNADGTPKISATTGTETGKEQTPPTADTSKNALDKYLQAQNDAIARRESTADIYKKTIEQTGLLAARQQMQNTQNQINAITTRMNTDLQGLRGVGAKEGVTEAVYGQQAAEVTREANLQILPLQAQLAADQGNVEMAQENTNTLFKMYSDDADRSYKNYEDQAKAIYEYASKDEQRKLDEISQQKTFTASLIKQDADNLASMASKLWETNPSAARALMSIKVPTNVNSPTLSQDYQAFKNTVGSAMAKYGVSTGGATADTNSLVNAMVNVNAGSAEGQQKRDAARVAQFVQQGKTKEAQDLILSRVTSKMTGAERSAELDRRNTIDALVDMKSALAEYSATTGDTGLVTGGIENIANKIGKTTDPKLAALKTRIIAATQKYRNSITGAAWGEQEAAEYKSIFPSITNTKKLNSTIIDTMIPLLQNNERNAIGLYLGGADVYDEVFSKPTTQTPTTEAVNLNNIKVSGLTVTTPQGVITFPSQQALNAFKKDNGIK